MERRKGKKIAKVAIERKLLEWNYHMLRRKITFYEMKKMANRRGELVMLSGYKGH